MSRLAALGLVLLAALATAQEETLRLADGRVLVVSAVEREGGTIRASTPFGPLVFPADRLARGDLAVPPPPAGLLRSTESRWLLLESDLDHERHCQLADSLERFARYLVRHYELEAGDLPGAPYRVRAWRRRDDFKRAQAELAPAISKLKGEGFGEGVAGFFAPELGEVHFFDGGGERVGARLELAQHELTHLFNHALARKLGRPALPTWFEEGSAVYYSMTVAEETLDRPDAPEPLEHAASLLEVVDDLENGRPYPLADLLAVPYADFHGREYSWAWALLREIRTHDDGKRWPKLLAWLAKGADPEDLRAVVGRDLPAFEKDWHRRCAAARPLLVDRELRRGERLVAAALAVRKPDLALARSHRAVARSYASIEEAKLALAFFESAWRGGAEEAPDRLLAARLRARLAGLASDEVWPDEALADLRRAVALDALLAEARLVLGEQLALRGENREAARELALALVLGDAGHDLESMALALLQLGEEGGEPEEVARLPRQAAIARALAKARLLRLQQAGRFGELLRALEALVAAGRADFDERLMLADLLLLTDEAERAVAELGRLVAERPRAFHLRSRLARALVAAGRRNEIPTLRAETLALGRKLGLDLGFVLERIDAAAAEDR